MTRPRIIAAIAALALAAVPSVAVAENDWCDDETPTTTSTPTTTVEPAPTTTAPPATVPPTTAPPTTIVTPAGPIPPVVPPVVQEPDPNPDRCIDTNGDGVGSTRQSLMVCFTTAEAELWVTTVWTIAYRYQVSIPTANAMLVALLGG